MPPHILVIDDQISLPRFIAMELNAEGYHVSISCDNIAELSAIRNLKPDLIVLNWELRSASGFEILRQLKLDHSPAPVVVITVEEERACYLPLELGIHTCLIKPFSMNDLLKAIEFNLKGKKQILEGYACN